LRPEVEGDGGDLVYYGLREAALGQVYGFEIALAAVAALHADVGQFISGINR
jgi:hypothetical protein